MTEAIRNSTGAKRKFASREECHKWLDEMYGSITDETFVRSPDLPLAVEEGYTLSALNALKRFQEQMKGEGEKAELYNDEDVAEWIIESRRKEELS